MIRKKRYLAAKMGLLALGLMLLFPGQAEAADKKTIYNSPYVSFSPDGKAFTTCAGDQNYTWYAEDDSTTVYTGIKSSLRSLRTGEHYYKVARWGEVPVGSWKVVHRPGQCIHDGYVSLHVPDYKTAVYEIKEVCGIKEISGQILAETQDHLILEGKDGKEISVAKKEIYDEMQTSIVEKAMSMDQNVRDQIDLIGNPKLSASQMDQILNGINDGLQPLLVAQYASPKIPAWQMDIYRYGMLNGLGYDQIKAGCLQDWDSSRNNIDNMIKEQRGHIVSDLKANNYIPEKRLVHKIGRLNGLMGGKFNKVSDIVDSVRSGKISNRYGEASLLKEIGEDLQHQRRVMSPAAQQKIHADAVPTR